MLRQSRVRSWPLNEQGDAVFVLDLARALSRSYRSDAHFAQYRSPNGRRLSGEALERGLEVVLDCVAFDCDCPATHGTAEPAPESWRVEMRQKLGELAREHPDAYYYETRGGARIVYRQQTRTVLRSRADAQRWRRDYLVAVAHLKRRFSIDADPACADWTRLFRLPRATRDGTTPESWPTLGDPARIGTLSFDATHEDLALARGSSKAFRSVRALDFRPSGEGSGLLFCLLRARGALLRQHGTAFVIRCPRSHLHSSGQDGDGSTLLYPPAAEHQIGAIHCFHAHCAGLSVREWLGEFSQEELIAARRAAGLARAA